jgi:ribose 5-phosphate isomerase
MPRKPVSLPDQNALKRDAAEAAVGLAQDGMAAGLATGSTAIFAVQAPASS